MLASLTKRLLWGEPALHTALCAPEGGTAVARALNVKFPGEDDAYWSTPIGAVVQHLAGGKDAVELFSDEWLRQARETKQERVVVGTSLQHMVSLLLTQMANDLGVDSMRAALLAASATKVWTISVHGPEAWFTANTDGIVIHISGPLLETADDPLTRHVLFCDPAKYTRICNFQPLPWVDLETLVPEPGVMCCTGLDVFGEVVYARMVTWGERENIGNVHNRHIGHIVARADELIASGRWRKITTPATSLAQMCGAPDDFMAHLAIYGHVMTVATVPSMCTGPGKYDLGVAASCVADFGRDIGLADIGTLAQKRTEYAPGCVLAIGTTETLAQLRVFNSADFVRMCRRFRAAGCADLDTVVERWLLLELPILSGEIDGGGGDAVQMHADVRAAVTSHRTYQRMWNPARHFEHWSVTAVDSVLPSSAGEDARAMSTLGLLPAATAPPCADDPLLADVVAPGQQRKRMTDGAHTTFPVRVMMNPSYHMPVLLRVLADYGQYHTITGALAEFMRNEVAPFRDTLTTENVCAFRAACIRSPLYGRVFLWMCIEVYSGCTSSDSSGLLVRSMPNVQTGVAWKGGWTPVGMLSRFAASAYIDLGCGQMLYWRQVLSSRRAYLFEIDLTSLQQLAALLDVLPPHVHVIPCSWDGLCVSDIVGETVPAVLATYRPGTPLPLPGTCANAHYMLADCADYDTHDLVRTSAFVQHFNSTRWRHYTNNGMAAQRAAAAYSTYLSPVADDM